MESLRFDFRSSFWLNLHHRLYLQAQAFDAVRRGVAIDPPTSVWAVSAARAYREYRSLSAAQRASWEAAMQLYIDHRYTDDDFLEPFMAGVDQALSDLLPDTPPKTGGSLRAPMVSALETTASIYKETLWHDDDDANKQWILQVKPSVLSHTAALTSRLGSWYATPWPLGPYRLDVTRYANWAGCYTNTDPVHIVMSSGDFSNDITLEPVKNLGMTSLELVFHEASHTVVTPGYGTIGRSIEDAATALRVAEPEGLWHAIIFFTAGESIRQLDDTYTMFADRANLYTGAWKNYRKALIDYWMPYLKDGGDLSAALHKVVAAVAAS